ncbi:PagK family vesicle-borne virulence factor [Salmonella enterica]
MNKLNSVLLALVFAISAITFSSSAMATESGNKGFLGISFPWCKIWPQIH